MHNKHTCSALRDSFRSFFFIHRMGSGLQSREEIPVLAGNRRVTAEHKRHVHAGLALSYEVLKVGDDASEAGLVAGGTAPVGLLAHGSLHVSRERLSPGKGDGRVQLRGCLASSGA